MTQNYFMQHKNTTANDNSLKGVLSGKNLFNLTQSAVARQHRENYIIQGPSTEQNKSAEIKKPDMSKTNQMFFQIDLTEDSKDKPKRQTMTSSEFQN